MPILSGAILLSILALDIPPPTGMQVISFIGIALTWFGAAIAFYKLRQDFRRTDESQRESIAMVAQQVIVAWHAAPEQRSLRDKRIIEVAKAEIEDAFRQRGPTFVDAREFRRFEADLDRRLDAIETVQKDVLRELGATSALVREALGRRS